MKITIVYDTVYGNTEKIAEVLKEGIKGKNTIKMIEADDASADDVKDAEMLWVGSPTHGGWYTEGVKNFLKSIPENGLKDKRAVAFDTSSSKENESWFVKRVIDFFGNASRRIARELEKKGAQLAGSETFYVHGKEGPLQEGEVERAKEWAGKVTGK